jgi:nitric-oxide synthase, bacterial
VSTNLVSAQAAFTEAPAVSGCPVHWVADLASSATETAPVITEGGPDPKEVREFFELYKEHSSLTDAEWRLRVQDVVREIAETGTYVHTTEELTVGARLAWRHNTRCIGKLYWRGLTVRDFRHVTDPAAIAEGCLDHTEFVHNKGRIKPSITIFAPNVPGTPAAQVLNGQLISYAGHMHADGTIVGDPHTVILTKLAKDNGWAPEREGRFDVLPLVVKSGDGAISVHEIPAGLAHEVEIEHPTIPGLKEMGLRWWGFPSICDNYLSIGGINYPLAPFTGWYLAPEISARDFSDTYRYNLLPEIAEALGIDTSDVRSLWKDRAVVELTTAVLHSYDKAGIRMDDHHTAAQKFHKWTASEEKKGCPVEAEWAWMVPPISASLSPNFHREFEDVFKLPALIRREPLT